MPIIVQLALMHYQFETIHPFNDGNGRVGRLLVTILLCARNVLPQPLMYLSAYFEQNRQAYYDHLLGVSQRGEWREWISYFAAGVTEQAKDASARTGQLMDLWTEYRHRTAKIVRTAAAQRLIDELFSSPYVTINRAKDVMDVAFKSASATVSKLVEAGILREITMQSRNRVYRADQIFALLDSPTAGNSLAVTDNPEGKQGNSGAVFQNHDASDDQKNE